MKKNIYILICLLFLLAGNINVRAQSFNPQDPEIRKFIEAGANKLKIPPETIEKIIIKSEFNARSLDLLTPKSGSSGKRNWSAYRKKFLTFYRINLGKIFIRDNFQTLIKAEQKYGVDPAIVAAILNIESRYGENTGDFKTLDVLTTLAFYHPTRKVFFQQQLLALIEYTAKWNIDINSVYGSYAGALGISQFIPSSILDYAVDFNNDGTIDLNTTEDAIGSVANYFSRFGWSANQQFEKILTPVSSSSFSDRKYFYENINNIAEELKAKGVKPTITKVELEKLNFLPEYLNKLYYPLALVDLPDGDEKIEYRLGSNNYYVITRYNRSYDYATAVYELAAEFKYLFIK